MHSLLRYGAAPAKGVQQAVLAAVAGDAVAVLPGHVGEVHQAQHPQMGRRELAEAQGRFALHPIRMENVCD